jgi:hypothetical protein
MQPSAVIYKCTEHGQPVFQDKPCPGMAIATQQSTERKKAYDVATLERKLDRLQTMGVGLIQASRPQAPPRPATSAAPQNEDFHPKLRPRPSWGELDAETERETQRINAQNEHNNAVAASRLSQDLEQMQQRCGGQFLDYPYVGMSDERFRQCTKLARFGSATQVVATEDNGVPLRLYVFPAEKSCRVYAIDGVVTAVKPCGSTHHAYTP